MGISRVATAVASVWMLHIISATGAVSRLDTCDMVGFIDQYSVKFVNCSTAESFTLYTRYLSIFAGPAVNWDSGRVWVLDELRGPGIVQMRGPWHSRYNASTPPELLLSDSTMLGASGVYSLIYDEYRDRLIVFSRNEARNGGRFYSISMVNPQLELLLNYGFMESNVMQMEAHQDGSIFFTDGQTLSRIYQGTVSIVLGTGLPCQFSEGACYISGIALDLPNNRLLYFMESQQDQEVLIKATSIAGGGTSTIYTGIKMESKVAKSFTPRLAYDKLNKRLYADTYRAVSGTHYVVQLPGTAREAVACLGPGMEADDCTISANTNPDLRQVASFTMGFPFQASNIVVLPGPTPVPSASPSPSPSPGADTAAALPTSSNLLMSLVLLAAIVVVA
jgi:hypothetical protein